MTITHPHHPLRGQRVAIIRVRRGADPDLIVRLPDGTHTALAMSSTDYAATPGAAPPEEAAHLLALDGLRPMVHLLASIHQQERGPFLSALSRTDQGQDSPYDEEK